MANVKQHKPIPDVVPVYRSEWSEYPDEILVAFRNGHFVRYQLEASQPHPAFRKVIDLIDNMPVYGGYKATKNAGGCDGIQPAGNKNNLNDYISADGGKQDG